ncbi:MAG: hypothetical protein E4H26_09920 [Flavobacteriales bacterium]|nr:MAG: hypothetical protein E4H26_09920 [Flavobacteriales bacterium]
MAQRSVLIIDKSDEIDQSIPTYHPNRFASFGRTGGAVCRPLFPSASTIPDLVALKKLGRS